MKQTVMKQWVKALRSGKYKQTTGVLKKPRGGFCCLGVLCDIPFEVSEWAGMGSVEGLVAGEVRYNGISQSLAAMNDLDKKNFAELADFIEANWRKL